MICYKKKKVWRVEARLRELGAQWPAAQEQLAAAALSSREQVLDY